MASNEQETALAACQGNGSAKDWVTPKGVFLFIKKGGIQQMMDPVAELKELRRETADREAVARDERKPKTEIPRTYRTIEDRKYPMSRKERRSLAREARKNGAKGAPFKQVWGEMVREGAYIES